MKLFVISDLHIEFGTNWNPPKDLDADVIILAGDIHNGRKAFEWINRKFPGKQVIYVAGNHEYYNHQHPGLRVQLNMEAHKYPNIHFLDDTSVEIGGILFIGATLWTDYKLFNSPPYSMHMCNEGMTDHDVITMGRQRFMAEDARELHTESVKFIEEELFKVRNVSTVDKQKTVVITHHCPSAMSVAPRFKMNEITPGFASDLSELIFKYEPTLWIHGHTHDAFDYELGVTRVVCNPHGYPREASQYKPGVFVEV
jgi:Icc-related predicted phosphoesterase